MNDQWSGNTLSRALRTPLAAPRRSSIHRTSRGTRRGRRAGVAMSVPPAVPEPGPYRVAEVALGLEEAVAADRDGQLRQRPGGGSEDGPGVLVHVEGGLVARAQEQPPLGLVEADGAAHVG